MEKLRIFIILISMVRLIPHLLFYKFHNKRATMQYDVKRWLKITQRDELFGFVNLMTFFPEFRNLFYNRIGKIAKTIEWLCPPMASLLIATKDIGPGLFIQHGIATIIAAKSIGKDCWINQQVTIGYKKLEYPTVGDNVSINAGAKVLGNVHMGNNSRAGANAVVVKNVPENCTVVGVPAYIIKRNGIKVKEEL
jgi:serine O-acetyltransferase